MCKTKFVKILNSQSQINNTGQDKNFVYMLSTLQGSFEKEWSVNIIIGNTMIKGQ